MKRLRSALLSAYKVLLAVTRVLPPTVRSRVDSWGSFILLRVANTPDDVLEARLDEALQTLLRNGGADELGDYLEFGVSFGSSLACMYRVAQRRGIRRMRFFGFDSFEGLPDAARTDDGGYWSPGMFKSDIRMTRRFLAWAGIDCERDVTLVKGWFSETLNRDLLERHGLRKASVIMIDCDMYLSAKQALDWMILMKEELGERWLRPDLFRIGASALLSDIERQIEHFATGRYSAFHRHPMP